MQNTKKNINTLLGAAPSSSCCCKGKRQKKMIQLNYNLNMEGGSQNWPDSYWPEPDQWEPPQPSDLQTLAQMPLCWCPSDETHWLSGPWPNIRRTSYPNFSVSNILFIGVVEFLVSIKCYCASNSLSMFFFLFTVLFKKIDVRQKSLFIY